MPPSPQAIWPTTIEGAVYVLDLLLEDEDKQVLKKRSEDDLKKSHFGMAFYIRNHFGLWGGNKELLRSCGSDEMHPDEGSTTDGVNSLHMTNKRSNGRSIKKKG